MTDVPQVSAVITLDVGAVAPPQETEQPEQEDEGDE